MSYLLLLIYDIPSILGISVGITLILFTLVYMRSKTSSNATFRSFILFMSIFILWMIAASNCSRVLFQAPDLWWDLNLITVYLMLPAGHYMLMHMADTEYTRRFCILIAVHLLILCGVLAVDLTLYRGALFFARQYYFCFAAIGAALASYWIYCSRKNGNPFSSAIVWPVAICFAAYAFDCISLQHRLWPRTIYFTAFTAPLFTVFLIRILDINVRGRLHAELRVQKLDADIKTAQEQANTDPLTGAFNRRKFEESYRNCLDVALSTDRRFSLIILDIDHFKHVNDTWGHNAGDLTLKHFSKLILSMTDRRHTLIRWGGEEFILLCRHQDLSEAAAFADEIRRQVEYAQINPHAPLTCSIGVSTWHGESSDPTELIRRADEALYRAKEKGRNRVEIETYT
ncbi:hypothetical protein TAMA11512_17870 [Selenomonas sp. TAMA-11512]|uniref:GGDEF domain-containing protein n=1 Tax=Selenomonas sp. TAMA-11512 TaxID=3095337 RepID=UPI0030877838|nr:hypothetical protein TAMA11512_17870 [Selenomonas sp. TAMA-11512]